MGAKTSILVVDDDLSFRQTLFHIFENRGYVPIAVPTGRAALDKIKEEVPAVALIDLRLEGMPGLEVMKEIKERSPDTECIVLTGHASQTSAIEAVNLGAYSYVQKPCDMEQLMVTVRRAIEKRDAEKALRESEKFLQDIFDGIQDGISVLDPNLNITQVNRWIERTHHEEMPLIGRKCYEAYQKRKSPCPWCPSVETLSTGEVQVKEVRVPSADGSFWWCELSAYPLKKENGSIMGVIEHVKDITERKQVEEKIRQRTAQLEALQQVGLELTAQLDLDALLRSIVSRAVELLEGTSGSLALYRPDQDLMERGVTVGIAQLPPRPFARRGEGLSGKIMETGEPLIVDDYQHWEGRMAEWEGYPIRAVVGVPVRWGDEFLGVLDVDSEVPCAFSPADAELLGLFATQAAIAIRNARLYEEIRRRALEQETVSRIAYALNTLDVRDAFPVLMEGLQELTGCDEASLLLMDETEEQFVIADLKATFPAPGKGNVMPLSDTAALESLEVGRPHLTADLSTETHFPLERALYQAGLRSRVTLPLLSGGEVFGALMLGSGNTGLFQESQSPVLQQIADAVALSVENSLLFQAEREQRKLAEALEEAAAAVSSTLEPDQVLDRILEQVERVVAGDAFNIMLIEEGTVRMVRWRGYERLGIEKRIAHFSAPVVELPSLVQMVQTGEPAVIPDTSADPDWALLEGWEWLRSYVGALIRVGGVTVGVLNVDGTRPGQFGPADAHRLKVFADHAAAAIENARLFEQAQQEIAERKRAEGELQQSLEQLRKTFEGTVDVLKSTIEIRDPYTAGHQQQVTQLAHAIASEMGLPEKQIEGIRVAGMIHDIGKISVPAQILSKPGELNILEYGLIKQHPRIGYDLLKTIDFPWPVAQIVLQHHERMDGSGYPAGLSGDKIMLEARILAVADVVAAMSSHRPYRSALGIDKALEEISQNRGVLYDAEVVDVCLKLFTEKRWEFN